MQNDIIQQKGFPMKKSDFDVEVEYLNLEENNKNNQSEIKSLVFNYILFLFLFALFVYAFFNPTQTTFKAYLVISVFLFFMEIVRKGSFMKESDFDSEFDDKSSKIKHPLTTFAIFAFLIILIFKFFFGN